MSTDVSGNVDAIVQTVPAAAAWHTVALSFGGGSLTAYLDDVAPVTVAASGTLNDVGSDLWVGENPGFTGRGTVGRYDEFALFPTAITAVAYRRLRDAFLRGRRDRMWEGRGLGRRRLPRRTVRG